MHTHNYYNSKAKLRQDRNSTKTTEHTFRFLPGSPLGAALCSMRHYNGGKHVS